MGDVATVQMQSRAPTLKELLRSGKASTLEIQVALARWQSMAKEWEGTVGAQRAHYKHAPSLGLALTKKGFYIGGNKLNNERGHGCVGQGKRHQNAAVHMQPKKNRGKLAKWCSVSKHRQSHEAE